LPIDYWADIDIGMATLKDFDYPKKIL